MCLSFKYHSKNDFYFHHNQDIVLIIVYSENIITKEEMWQTLPLRGYVLRELHYLTENALNKCQKTLFSHQRLQTRMNENKKWTFDEP
jgi:hypothetical protein